MSKPWLIIFEGQDSSGKTTLIDLLNKKTNYEHTIIDRAFISTAVYSKKFNRCDDISKYLEMLELISKAINVLVIVCYVNPETAIYRERQKIKHDYVSKNITSLKNEIENDKKLFQQVVNQLNGKVEIIEIDTSLNTPEQSAQKILKEFIQTKEYYDRSNK